MLCIGITYNILGGLGSIGGIAFSVFALVTFVISQFAKVILFESANQNLEAPELTIAVYLMFYFCIMLGTFVFGRVRLPLPKPLEPRTDKQMNLMYLFSLVVGTLATFILAGGELLTGGGDESTSHSFAVGFQGLLLFAVVLAVQSRLRRSNGLHSVDMKVLIPWIIASSAEFVGGLRFGESSKRVKQGHFHGFIGSKAEGSSGNHSYLVVETLDGAA